MLQQQSNKIKSRVDQTQLLQTQECLNQGVGWTD